MNLRGGATEASANPIILTDIRCVPAGPTEVKTGLLAWVSFTLGGRLRIDGVTVRRTRRGRPYLSFPERQSSVGKKFFSVTPIDGATRQEIERQVFAAIGLKEDYPPC